MLLPKDKYMQEKMKLIYIKLSFLGYKFNIIVRAYKNPSDENLSLSQQSHWNVIKVIMLSI